MMETNLTGGTGNDTFTLTQGIDSQTLRTALLKFGVTPAGVDQFLHELPPSTEEDRGALQEMLLSQLTGTGGGTTSCQCVLLRSALLKSGVTPFGAYQFIEWLPVSSPADRAALQAMFLAPRKAGENLLEAEKVSGG
jgi:hypothetical protein